MKDVAKLCMVCHQMATIVPEVIRLLQVDFSTLRLPRYNYEEQTEVDQHRVDMASAAMLRHGNDPGRFVAMMGGEYTGENRDVEATLERIEPHVREDDFNHIKRILTEGCPACFDLEETTASKLETLQRGNNKHFLQHPEIVKKTINKEDRYSHLIPLAPWLAYCSPYLRTTPQIMVLKAGKNARMAWNGSGKWFALEIVLNEITPTDEEADITFGEAKPEFYKWLYNMRASFPFSDILLALADIKACFRYPRIHRDLTGAFGFMADGFYCLATSMVFGSTTSASSWEPFRRAIEVMTSVYFNYDGLVEKHEKYLSMIKWDTLCPPETVFVQAKKCPLNPGIFLENGRMKPLTTFIYVDDALLAAPGAIFMRRLLAAVIEAIFVVMGPPETEVRQCHLAMDKWLELCVGHWEIMLGIRVNTRTLMVGITRDYLDQVLDILDTVWPKGRPTFQAQEAQKMIGKLGRLSEGAHWVYHLMSHLYTSIAYALKKNKDFLKEHSKEFADLLDKIDRKHFSQKDHAAKHVNFALKQLARSVHHCKEEYPINNTMVVEIEFFREALREDSGITWESQLGFMIPRTPLGNCLEGGGGYSIKLRFWWHLEFPLEVILRTLLHKKDNKDGLLISINVLEFVTVIVNYAAAYTVITTEDITDDPAPVVLNITDNTSAQNWTLHACKTSMIGRRLGRFFCGLLIGSPLGINSQWISTDENELADTISRVKKQNVKKSSNHPSLDYAFDYSLLQQNHSELKACRFFQPAPELISMIWD
ncbi:hypothetical protein ACHAXR_003426, partial [Thalassiosira sp. AJA248-18]